MLSSATWMGLSSCFSLLLVSRLVLASMKSRLQEDFFTQIKFRIRTWAYILGLLSLSVYLGKGGIFWFFGGVSFLAFKELVSIVPIRIADRRTLFWGYLAIPIQYLLVAKGFYVLSLIFIPVYMLLFLPIRLTLTGETKNYLRSLSVIHWAMMTMVFCMAHIVFFFIPGQKDFPFPERISTIIYLILLTQLGDIAQFMFGKALGKKKILPKISPNKTWMGFLGGIATTTLMGFFWGPKMTPLTPILSLFSGLLIGVAGFLGDVTLSSLKRDLGIKDTSLMLPGHGGILDRIDSLIFTAPLFFHFFNFFWLHL